VTPPPAPPALPALPAPQRAGRWAGAFAEAEALAGRIRQLVERGGPVYDPQTGELRTARWGDVGILVRTRGETFRAIELAFGRCGVPLAAGGGTRFFARREITDMLNLLAVVENPTRDIELAAVLRSPLVELSDDALVLVAASRPAHDDSLAAPEWRGGRSRQMAPLYNGLIEAVRSENLAPQDLARAREFLALREELSALHLGAGDVLREAIARTGYDAKALARGHGTRELANAQKLLSAAEQFDRTEGGGLAAFREHVAGLRFAQRIEPAAHELESADAVKLLTMHAAKGLEFPIVCVADLGYDFLGTTERQGSYATDDLGVTLRDVDEYGTPREREAASQVLARSQAVAKAREEEARLLYVAMTRSRDRLILSGVRPSRGRSGPRPAPPAPEPQGARTMLDWVRFALGEAASALPAAAGEMVKLGEAEVRIAAPGASSRGSTDRVVDLAKSYTPGVELVVPRKLLPTKKDKAAANAATLRAKSPLTAPRTPAVVPATALRDFAAGEDLYWQRHVLGIEAAPAGHDGHDGQDAHAERGTGTAFGLAVHAALELADFSAPPAREAERLARERLSGSMSSALADRARGEIERFLSSEAARRIGRAEWIGREAPLAVMVGETLIDGVADIVWRDPEGTWGVIDYKTDVGSPSELAGKYRLQLAVYALAVARAAGTATVDASLHFLAPGEAVALGASPDEIEAEIAEVLARLGEFEYSAGGS